MHQFEPVAVFGEQGFGFLTRKSRPKQVQLEADVARVGVLHDVVEERTVAVVGKLVAVVVVAKRQAKLVLELFADAVEIRDGRFCIVQREGRFFHNPGDHDVLSSQYFSGASHLPKFGAVEQIVVTRTGAGAAHPAFVEHFARFGGRFVRKHPTFEVGNAQGTDAVERRSRIRFHAPAVGVGLHTGRLREYRSGRLSDQFARVEYAEHQPGDGYFT